MRLIVLLLAAMILCMPSAYCMAEENSIKPLHYAGLITIQNGRKLYLECQGAGSPTVLFISGRSDRSTIWQTSGVYPSIASLTHVCAYDRPGTVTITSDLIEPSRSTSVPQPTTPEDAVTDLHALLTAAKVPGPYILVGHSYGGLIARLFAATYPNESVGLVLIDTLTEFLYDALSEPQKELWIRLNSNYSPELDKYTVQERINFKPSFEQLRKVSIQKPLPAIVLTSDKPYDFKSLVEQGVLPADTPLDFAPTLFHAHLMGQRRLTQILDARQITQTHAGHYIQIDNPQLVINAIKEVVEEARKKQ